MTREGARETARKIAAQLDLTAFIYREGDGYQVACVASHTELTTEQQANCVAIVMPDGWEMPTAWGGE